ncbi:MerR family transcriptional regulator [Nitrogeniibacter mangrovi]|uniref:MerR family transcriptional regulator n=1 Tax=Nitrogeniibacter mangrovi TaxID=2016596 RepID=A0A6C1B8X2_9RHOO|nr:chaperone modulator CbpM [Nitrogeniibacter mangrovi]QID19409.1 MerR family transcriptional regulator [Nitrogeniibacter mangrovi]
MSKDDIFDTSVLDDSWLTVDQLAAACAVEVSWLHQRLDAGLFPHAECVAGVWRFNGPCLSRARRMRELERNFDAVPELAALFADLLDEMDALRARLRQAGLD